MPYALGAKFAFPDRPLIACIGDGAMQMLGNAALVDIVHYVERWQNKQCVILVLHNNDLNQVTWEQRVMTGDPKSEASQVLPDFPFARYAETLSMACGQAPGVISAACRRSHYEVRPKSPAPVRAARLTGALAAGFAVAAGTGVILGARR